MTRVKLPNFPLGTMKFLRKWITELAPLSSFPPRTVQMGPTCGMKKGWSPLGVSIRAAVTILQKWTASYVFFVFLLWTALYVFSVYIHTTQTNTHINTHWYIISAVQISVLYLTLTPSFSENSMGDAACTKISVWIKQEMRIIGEVRTRGETG